MRRFLLGLVVMAALATPLAAQTPARPAHARVTYLSGAVAYLDAGREDGLSEGMVVTVVRNGETIASLTVTDLASRRAACAIPESAAGKIVVGDTVAFTPTTRPAPAPDPGGAGIARSAGASRSGFRLRGRLGLRYLALRPVDGSGGFSQPALDLRLDLSQAGGAGVGATMDVRARQSYLTRTDGSTTRDSRTSVYQAALLVRSPNHPWRASLGRQYLSPVSSISLFDGLLVEAQGPRVGVGAFAGSEPDQATMGYSPDIRDYGAFVELRGAPGRSSRWSVATGAVGSYQGGEVNREFAFAQVSISTPAVTIFAAQEADLNRGWKHEAGEPSFALTSSFASINVRPGRAVSLHAGVDTRRRVRLYRDRANPELAFDDSFRQGIWSGATLRAGAHLRIGVDGRAALGGPDSTAHSQSVTGSVALERLTRGQLSLRTRYTRYGTVRGDGWLGTASLGARPAPWLGLEFNGGQRQEVSTLEPLQRRTTWMGADVDLALGRAFYLLLSGARERGDGASGDQVMVSLSVRF